MGRKVINLLNKTFGNLVVITRDRGGVSGSGKHARWLCKCNCGRYVSIISSNLISGHTKSCGCLCGKTNSTGNRLPNGEASFNQLLRHYKRSAKKRSLDFKLTRTEFRVLTKSKCYYCGEVPKNVASTQNNTGEYLYSGIDRKDNSLGYTNKNCVSCCDICNRAKLVRNEEEFKSWIIKVYSYFIEKEYYG